MFSLVYLSRDSSGWVGLAALVLEEEEQPSEWDFIAVSQVPVERESHPAEISVQIMRCWDGEMFLL